MDNSAGSIWVIGYGKFGRRAVDQLSKASYAPVSLTVIDSRAQDDVLDRVKYVHSDGVRWLVENFERQGNVRWIIPALPVHLAAQWVKGKLLATGKTVEELPIPEEIVQLLPNAYQLSDADYAVSHAPFICPTACMEPEEICTHTGRPRPQALYDMLGSLPVVNTPAMIIRSHQLGSGVGGLDTNKLWCLFDLVQKHEGRQLLLGTACKCHGIVSSFRFESRK